ncbi:hypothetical protein KSP40_PGU017399 [Platanthera guangdongensis]|uniref:Remorin C-terminal domain-containing protein n=1 Tax=Platanthera guangdongensis TaxID=2320717 RepID=A0ABR2MJX6_9ASPA
MDYERIHKVQLGVISPSKLRMKLLGAQHMKMKEGGTSSRASPSKLDTENAKINLLVGDLDDEACPKSHKKEFSTRELFGHGHGHQTQSSISTGNSLYKGISDARCARNQNDSSSTSQTKPGNNFGIVHPMKHQEEEDNNNYDSGHESATTSSFEFHGGGRISHHPVIGPFSRQIPSKWNDAEKWLVNRQGGQENVLKKGSAQFRVANSIWARIAPESMIAEQKPAMIQPAASNTDSQNITDKFSFISQGLRSNLVSSNDASFLTDPSQAGADLGIFVRIPKDLSKESSVSCSFPCGTADIPAKLPISMRDIGTEMTPIPSQGPSKTGTPIENLTPSRSPISSIPSSPGKRSSTVDMMPTTNDNKENDKNGGKKFELSERELQLKTRKEIAALGLQLGKLNIASWAGKDAEPSIDEEDRLKQQYETRAAAWLEAEKSKHMARYKGEEIKIQAWESYQRAKCEAKMRKVEIQTTNMRTQAEATIAEKLRATEQTVEKKRANAEAKMNYRAAKTSQQAEQIRQSGRLPSDVRCWSCFL